MSVWPVFVQGWQFECCGETFAVRDEVTWTLVMHEDDFGLPAAVSEVRGRRSRVVVDDHDVSGVAVVVGGLTVWSSGGEALHRDVRLRGLLLEDHHADVPAGLPATRGLVRRIRVVTHTLQLTAPRTWEPSPAVAPRLRDVEQLPTSFASGGDGAFTSDTGVLVDLDVGS